MFSKKEKLLLLVLASIQFSSIVDFIIMMPLGPQLIRSFGINSHQFGMLVSAYTLFAGLSGFSASFFLDKVDRKASLLFFFIGFSLGTIACGLAHTFPLLLLARGITGLFGGVLGSLVMAIVSDAISYERRGSAMGIIMTAFSVASIMGVPFSLYLANLWGWNTPFLVLGVLSLILCAVVAKAVPSMKEHLTNLDRKAPVLQSLTSILQSQNQRRALMFMAAVMFGHFAIVPFISQSLVFNAGLTEAQLPLMYMIGGVCTIFSSPLIGRASDFYGKKKIFLIGAIVTLLPYWIITHFDHSPVWYILFICAFFFVSSGGRMIPASALVSSTAFNRNRGSFMSIVSCVQQLASAAGSYAAGLIVTTGVNGRLNNFQMVGYISIAFTFVAIYLSRNIEAVDIGPSINSAGSAKDNLPSEVH